VKHTGAKAIEEPIDGEEKPDPLQRETHRRKHHDQRHLAKEYFKIKGIIVKII
jgi:hypothetical protein